MHDPFADIKMEQQHHGLHHDQDFGEGHMVDVAEDHSPHHFVQMGPIDSRPMQSSFENSSPPAPIPLHRLILPRPKTAPDPTLALAPALSKPPHTPSSSRRTLTDSDRRRMCEYHSKNPNVKQTKIGAMFGVDRSTVSKVLRYKENYLLPEEGSQSPIRRWKSEFPDIERTLSQWAKNRLSQGLSLDDKKIRDQARIFATTVGSTGYHDQVNDLAWLEDFKAKNHLPGAKPPGEREGLKSGSETPNGISPIGWDGLPISSPKDDLKIHSPDSYMDGSAYGHAHSQSTASLKSCFSDMSSFVSDSRSPTSPFFSPMSSDGPSLPAFKMARLPPTSSLRRRQTVPLISAETSPDSATSKHLPQSTAASSLESPPEEMEMSPLSASEPARIRTTNAIPLSMALPSSVSLNTANTSPSIGSVSPSSAPSHDEARAALSTLMTFIKHQPNGAVDPYDYLVMGKWMHMLKLETGELPGGMQAIPMSGRADGTLPIGRKRSAHSLS